MESGIDGDILLLGEANFSFTLSLLNYCNPRLVTTTCYESRMKAEERYGKDILGNNLNRLAALNCENVLFEIDACYLKENFGSSSKKFTRIIFMFPHVSGRSNLKKNRILINDFFKSARDVLDFKHKRPSIFIALTNGQGGTQFEEDPAKRNVKDSWQVLQIAQKNGFILTECFKLNESKFPMYKSTGFRSQAKSFETKASLVHRFEPSLSLLQEEFNLEIVRERLKDENFDTPHPLNQFNRVLATVLKRKFPELLINIIEEIYIKSKNNNNNNNNNNDKPENPSKNNESVKLFNNPYQLNLLSELFIEEIPTINNSLESILDLNRIKYLVLVKHKTSFDRINSDELLKFHKKLNSELYLFIKRLSKIETSGKYLKVETIDTEFTACIDVSLLLKNIFNLDDERLLFSDDKRVLLKNTSSSGLNVIKAFSIQNSKWIHDISFWYDPNDFNFPQFVQLIKVCCMGYVRSIELLNKYLDISSGNKAVCFRFVYQSCDRALSWDATSEIQIRFRERLEKEFKSVKLR